MAPADAVVDSSCDRALEQIAAAVDVNVGLDQEPAKVRRDEVYVALHARALGGRAPSLVIIASLIILARHLKCDGNSVETLNQQARPADLLMDLQRLQLELERSGGLPVRTIQAPEAVVGRAQVVEALRLLKQRF